MPNWIEILSNEGVQSALKSRGVDCVRSLERVQREIQQEAEARSNPSAAGKQTRQRCLHPDETAPYVPSPEEIELRAAEIRKGWSEQTRKRRMVSGPVPFVIPVISFSAAPNRKRRPAE